jgi:hypothetical protein
MRKHLISSVGLVVLLTCTDAKADTILFANLNPLEEIITPAATSGTPVGPGGVLKPFLTSTGGARPPSFGTSTFVLNAAETALSLTATIFNIDVTGTQTPDDTNDNLVAAHIHSGALQSVDERGVEARAITWGFFGAPDNDNNPDQLVVTPFVSGVGGIITTVWDLPEGQGGTSLAVQIPRIFAGLAYINFHTGQFGNGEIRDTLQVRVPEPGSLGLLALALGGIYVARRRRRT